MPDVSYLYVLLGFLAAPEYLMELAILLAQPSVDNVFGRLLVVTSSFPGFGFRHSAIGPSLSRARKFGTLFRSGSDNRVTIYRFSNRN